MIKAPGREYNPHLANRCLDHLRSTSPSFARAYHVWTLRCDGIGKTDSTTKTAELYHKDTRTIERNFQYWRSVIEGR